MERTISRRRFVRGAAFGTGLIVLSHPLLERTARAVPLASDVAFAEGVAAGEPAERAITLWTKLDGLTEPRRLNLEVSADPGFGSVLHSEEVLADPALGGSARTRLANGALQPGEQYWYRFAADGVDSPVGRFRTARPADSAEPVTIAFFSCQEYIAGYYHAHRDLAAREDVDLVICLGDYIYETGFAGTLSNTGAVRKDESSPSGSTQTVEEYRAKYALYNRDPNLQAVRAKHAMVAIWDDHEVEDNYAGTFPGTTSTPTRRVPFEQRRGNGYKVHYEAMPRLRDLAQRDRTYGAIQLGAAELLMLDTRQFRNRQPCDKSVALGCSPYELNRGYRTLLGSEQKSWLKNRLKGSAAPWKLVANQVMIMSFDAAPGVPIVSDAWDGYAAERAEVIDYLQANRIKDVSFLTGDIHTFFAGEVTRTGRAKTTIQGRPNGVVATEFVGGSITSPAVVDRAVSKESDRKALAKVVDGFFLANNPHMTYANSAYHGYGIATASAQELRVQYRAARDIRKEGTTDVFTLAEFRVPRGSTEMETTRLSSALPALQSGPVPDRYLKDIGH